MSSGPVDAGGPISAVGGKANAAAERLRALVAPLAVGSRIPGERDLADAWGISRMTARKAVEALVAEGLLERRQGSGSFVTEVPSARLPGLSSFSAEIRQRGGVPASDVVSFQRELAVPADIRRRLGVSEREEVTWFSRRRRADGLAVALETTWIPARVVPGLTPDDLYGSLFDVLDAKFGVSPGQATSVIDAVGADEVTAAALEVDVGDPCLRVEMDYLDTRRHPLMAAKCLYRPDRYQLRGVVMQNGKTSSVRAS